MISGSVVIDGRVLRAGDFHHAEGDSDHGEFTTTEAPRCCSSRDRGLPGRRGAVVNQGSG